MRETADCSLEDFGDVMSQMMQEFNQEICDGLKKSVEETAKEMEEETHSTAPSDRGKYAKAISSKKVDETPTSITWAWYVKPPHHRLTHLLAFGHQTRNGGRTRADNFLHTAVENAKRNQEKKTKKVIEDAAG